MKQHLRLFLASGKDPITRTKRFTPYTDVIVPPIRRRVDRLAWVPEGRALHLIDIENLMGGPLNGIPALERAISDYMQATLVGAMDQFVVACNPGLAFLAGRGLPKAQLLMRAGSDGADLALIEWASDVIWIAGRFDRLIIGSGDGIFETVAYAYRALGIEVGVVARQGSISDRLGRASSWVTHLHNAKIVEASE